MARICVLGGSGFIGRHVVNRLVDEEHVVIVPTRLRAHAKHLYILPSADVVQANVHDDTTLARLVEGCDAVINLVGVLNGPFEQPHVTLPRRLARICAEAGVRQIAHMSALGASADGPSNYLKSKAAGEDAVLEARDRLAVTVYRPSVVFGPEDRFLNLFAALNRWFPVIFLGAADAKFQPVYVCDVAEVIVRSLFDADAAGRRFELCGPTVYTLRELVAFAGRATGHARPIVGLPHAFARLQAATLEFLPGKMMSRDNLRSLQVANVCNGEFPYGLEPRKLESAAMAYLSPSPTLRYNRLRWKAGR